MQKTERVVRKWMRLFMMLGSLLLLFHGSTVLAKAAEAGGADVVSLINTITGMKIDINRRTFALANKQAVCPVRL